MNKKLIFSAIAVATLLASCQTARHAALSSAIEGEWNITEVNGSAVKSGAYIGFNTGEKRVYGNSGCNNIAGSFNLKAKKGQIEFGPMLSTMMACPDMESEQRVLQALNSVERVKLSDDEHLVLCDNHMKPLLQMERRFHTVPLSAINGKWRIVTALGENISDAEEVPYVNFDTENSRISAYAGCNRLSAGITGGEKNALTFSDVLSTRMACPDMTAEQNVSTALEQVRNFGISPNGNLLLFSAGGNVVMELMRINE